VDRIRPWNAPLEIPECPKGWTTGPPEYVGIGAQRCGTSWWYAAMRRHPAIERSPLGKEVHYFDRFWQGDAPDDIAAEYASLFPRSPGKVIGEWTPRYLADFWAAPLIRKAVPDARILVMLRDPVDRYRSAMAWLSRSEDWESRGILAWISDATWRGFYYQQLRRVFDFFPREQVLVLQFERCVSEPIAEMERTWRFLGLEPPSSPPDRLLKHKQAGRTIPKLTSQVAEELAARYREDALRLAELCPEIELSLWTSVTGEKGARPATKAGVGAS
jgi:Sulfotransferase family